MGGGLMQLVAYGAQDVYLTGNPQITFFKVVYRRHTNFAMECIEQTLTGNPNFGRKSTCTITRNGDLITKMYLRVVLDVVNSKDGYGTMGWVRRIGHALIDYVELDIGGSQIDKHYGTWLDIWYELSHSAELERGYNILIGDVPQLTNLDAPVNGAGSQVKDQYTLFIPLQFWFCRNTGLALPLIALQYHEVRVDIEFTNAYNLVVQSTDFNPEGYNIAEATLLVDYIYLDSEERRRFAQVGHEYLIEQLQFTGEESAQTKSVKIKLGFNHPCKELIWAIRNGNYFSSSSQGNAFLAYSNTDDWSAAIQAAADNIATGMIAWSLAGVLDPTSYVPINTTPSLSGVYNVTYDGNAIEVDLTFIPLTGQTPSILAFLVMNVFVSSNGSINLGDYIESISATVSQDGDAVNGYYCDVAAVATSQTFTIRWLSVPVSLWTDNRFNNDPVLGNPNDVLVFQWSNYGMYIDGTGNPVSQALIQLNGHDRFDIREGQYFNYVQPFQHHTRTPADGINIYSFALHPEQHQPSGTCNLSRIDNTQLNIFFNSSTLVGDVDIAFLNSDTKLYIYAVNYNVLRIMSGMGGLAYSN